MTVEIYGTAAGVTGWINITPFIAWQGLTFSRNDIDGPEAGRTMNGTMHRCRVSSKEKMQVTTKPLTKAQSAMIQSLIFPESFSVRVTPYPRTNAAKTMTMYSNNVSTTFLIHRQSGEELCSLSFPLIEN